MATTHAHPLVSPALENSLTTGYMEPPVGIEPTTFSLREVRLLVRGCPYNALSGVFDLSVTRVDPPVTPRWLPRWLPQLSTMDAASPLPQTVSLPRRNCSAHAVRRSPRRQLVGRRTTRGGPVSTVTSWAVSRCAHSCALSSVDRVPRLYGYCGDIPPTETETAYYAQNRAQPTAEFSNREVSGHTGAVQCAVLPRVWGQGGGEGGDGVGDRLRIAAGQAVPAVGDEL